MDTLNSNTFDLATTPLREVNAGTVLFQFAIVLAALIFANRWLVARNSGP